MLCSRCNEIVRPVVMLDIDGTLGDYHGHFLSFANMWLGVGMAANYDARDPLSTYDGSLKFSDWFCEQYAVDVTTFREIKLAYRQGAQKRCMPLNPAMDRFVQELRGGVNPPEIWITTTRPYLNLSGIDTDTRFWLRQNGIPYDYLVYDEDKYIVLAGRVDLSRVVLVVDDEVDNLHAALACGYNLEALTLYRTRYNKGVRWHGREASHASGLAVLAANNIEQWEQRNG